MLRELFLLLRLLGRVASECEAASDREDRVEDPSEDPSELAQLPAPPRPTWKTGATCVLAAMRSMSSSKKNMGRSLACCTLPLPPRPVKNLPFDGGGGSREAVSVAAALEVVDEAW